MEIRQEVQGDTQVRYCHYSNGISKNVAMLENEVKLMQATSPCQKLGAAKAQVCGHLTFSHTSCYSTLPQRIRQVESVFQPGVYTYLT